jgi:hypothetical protein
MVTLYLKSRNRIPILTSSSFNVTYSTSFFVAEYLALVVHDSVAFGVQVGVRAHIQLDDESNLAVA